MDRGDEHEGSEEGSSEPPHVAGRRHSAGGNIFGSQMTRLERGGLLAPPIPVASSGNHLASEDDGDEEISSGDDFTPRAATSASLSSPTSIITGQRREARSLRYAAHAFSLAERFPLLRSFPLLLPLSNTFSFEATGALGVSYFLVKGMTAHTVSASTLPMFKDVLKVTSGEYQAYVRIGVLGWAMKPLIGVLSDQVTFFNYHKRFYLVWACVVGAVAANVWALLPGEPSFAAVAACCTFLCNLCLAVVDLLCEGRYSRMIQAVPQQGSSLVTWVWAWVMAGGVVAASVQGPMADSGLAPLCLQISSVLLLVAAVPLYKNWLAEKRVLRLPSLNDERRGRLCCPLQLVPVTSQSSKNAPLTLYCIAMAACTLMIAVSTVWFSRTTLLIVSTLAIIGLSTASFFVLPKVIALANLYMFLKEALYVQLPGPMDYFFTTTSCGDSFPQFSYSFYQTFTTIIGYVAGAVGVAVFHRYYSTRNFRLTFWTTSLIRIIASLFDLVLITRVNRTLLGISDHVVYFWGDAIVFGACQMLDFMPAVILLSKLCPKGMEATLYALMAGYSNLGQAMSNSIGSLLMHPSLLPVEGCDVSNLPALVFVGHCALPLLSIPLTFLLVPNTRVDEEIAGIDAS